MPTVQMDIWDVKHPSRGLRERTICRAWWGTILIWASRKADVFIEMHSHVYCEAYTWLLRSVYELTANNLRAFCEVFTCLLPSTCVFIAKHFCTLCQA